MMNSSISPDFKYYFQILVEANSIFLEQTLSKFENLISKSESDSLKTFNLIENKLESQKILIQDILNSQKILEKKSGINSGKIS